MDRCKLEYMIRNFSAEDRSEIIFRMTDTRDWFNTFVRDFLLEPDMNDIIKLSLAGIHKPEQIETWKEIFASRFKYLNELCLRNKTMPFFDNPDDLRESELMREELLKRVSERYLNAWFGCDSYYSYKPPIYEPDDN